MFKKCDKKYNIKGHVVISRHSEDKMLVWLYHKGPIIAGMCATKLRETTYSGGVYFPHDCSSCEINHTVLIVGYGVERSGGVNLPYWIIKNSWGPEWGEEGYMKLQRGSNTCRISEYVVSALLD